MSNSQLSSFINNWLDSFNSVKDALGRMRYLYYEANPDEQGWVECQSTGCHRKILFKEDIEELSNNPVNDPSFFYKLKSMLRNHVSSHE